MRTTTPTGTPVHDHSGIRIGTADADGRVVDDGGVHIGTLGADGRVLDLSGSVIGAAGAPRPH